MVSPADLPHLLKLLDDDSPEVRKGVVKGLLSLGPELGQELLKLSEPPSPEQNRLLNDLMEEQFESRLRRGWSEWLTLPSDTKKLAWGFELLSEYQGGLLRSNRLTALLGGLAAEYLADHADPDALSLISFLFKKKCLRGEQEQYYAPDNSDLAAVIEKKSGLPISLACIAILTGQRVGVEIQGCNFPRHFLARIPRRPNVLFVDCFNGGELYHESQLGKYFGDSKTKIVAEALIPASPETILARVLRNLNGAYKRHGSKRKQALMYRLLSKLEQLPNFSEHPRFEPGQLVTHKRYGYHGVVVDVDPSCKASGEWYRANRTQPDRDQPWYHVLVSGSDACTYAAEENLERDSDECPILNPLLDHFFTAFKKGRYVRNDRPWKLE